MKIKLILLLIFLISCSSETSTESLNEVNNDEDEYLEEEYEEDSDEEEYEEDSDEEENDGESLYDEYGEWDKGTTYYDTSSSTSSGWYIGQGTDREEHVHEGMQTSDGGYIAVGHHWEKEEDPTGYTAVSYTHLTLPTILLV